MNKIIKVIIVVALVAAIAVVLVAKNISGQSGSGTETVTAERAESQAKLPVLIEFGAGKCVACKMMKPVIADIKKRYAGSLEVETIDIMEDSEAAGKYDIRIIPTQVFLDANGVELFRNNGFYSQEDIVAKWNELGVELEPVSEKSGGKN